MTPFQLRQTIETALEQNAPEKHAELRKAGRLKAFLDSRVETALQEIEAAEQPQSLRALQSDSPYLDRVQGLTQARKQAEGAAIAHAIEF